MLVPSVKALPIHAAVELPIANAAPELLLVVGLAGLVLGPALALFRLRARGRVASEGCRRESGHVGGDTVLSAGAPSRLAPDEVTSATGAAEPRLTRVSPGALEPLGRCLESTRRLRAAEEQVAHQLAALPAGFWLTERYVAVGERRVPFVVAGATGVFALWPSDGAWTMQDVRILDGIATELAALLPGYDGPVHAAVVLAFDSVAPRAWHRGDDGRGAWVVGLDQLAAWMFGFGPEHALYNGDVARLEQEATPRPERRSDTRLPSAPNLG